MEDLEDRTLLSGGITTTTGLSDALNSANTAGGATTITLASGTTFDFTSAYQSTNNALPVITGNITIVGNNDTIERTGANPFRLFDVASSATLTLDNLTLTGGMVSGATAQGGAVYISGGTVNLSNCNLSGQAFAVTGAAGSAGGNVQGGGIYALNAMLTLTNTNVFGSIHAGNGGNGSAPANHFDGGAGGNAQGGAIYALNSTVTVSGGLLSGGANPGDGGNGASGTSQHLTGGAGGISGMVQGAGVYVQGGSLTIDDGASLVGCQAGSHRAGSGGDGYNLNGKSGAGGAGGDGNVAEGGGVFASNATVVMGNASILGATLQGAYGGDGGTGGPGKTGGRGGNAGLAAGGGLYVEGGSVKLSSGATVLEDVILPGWGGNGGKGGTGGNGGNGATVEGGGLAAINAPVTLTMGASDTILPSITPQTPGIIYDGTLFGPSRGGNGGEGTTGAGGNGGNGGLAQGGGVFASGSGLAVVVGTASQGATVIDNNLDAGYGGSAGAGHAANGLAGNGGLGAGGGVAVVGDKLSLTNATVTYNSAWGGAGGNGATSKGSTIGNYGDGGDAQGGGLFVIGSSVSVLNSTVADNDAEAKNGASGGVAAGSAKYGLGGTAQGGGMYDASSTVNILNSTFANNLLYAGTQVGTSHSTGGHSTGGGTAQGGGLYATGGHLSLTNDTIAWNYLDTATNRGAVLGQGGGIFNGPSNTLSLENTIVALDLSFSNSLDSKVLPTSTNGVVYNDLGGSALALNDQNLIGDGIDANAIDANLAPATSTQLAGSQQLFAAPFSNYLATYNPIYPGQAPGKYGGLTPTLPLAWSTSPAISTGNPAAAAAITSAEGLSSATGQRGFAREIDGTIDIGATETQVILDGSPSVTTVQGGGTITYTLKVTNNESTTANVTLTDVLDPNTTYQSSSGTNWTITPPNSSSPGGTLTATISLAANSWATLTITVTVASNAPGNTTLMNTASIVPTGNGAAGARSVMMDTQTQGATDISKEIGIFRTPVLPDRDDGPNSYVQGALLFNWSGVTLTGPIALVLVGLPSDVTLTNASGYYDGNPYIIIVPPNGSWKPGWWNFLIAVLEFSAANRADIQYTPEILQGI